MSAFHTRTRRVLAAALAFAAVTALAVAAFSSISRSADAQPAFTLTIDDPAYSAAVSAYSFNAGVVGANDPDALLGVENRWGGVGVSSPLPARVFIAISSGDAAPLYRLATLQPRVPQLTLTGPLSELVLTGVRIDGAEISETPDRDIAVALSYETLQFSDVGAGEWCWDFERQLPC
jgi:hypothetical protein